jgi:hypothetical protein
MGVAVLAVFSQGVTVAGCNEGVDALDRNDADSEWIGSAYRNLLALANGNYPESALAELGKIRREFDAMSTIFGRAALPEIATREGRFNAEIYRHTGALDKRGLPLSTRGLPLTKRLPCP